ncbi:MAG: glycosyltransferase family 9 protein [bacterium]
MNGTIRKRFKQRVMGWAANRLRRPQLTPQAVRELAPRRILIVRQHNQMGDMICATPSFRALRTAFPEAEMVLVCATVNWEVVRHNPDLDGVLLYDKKVARRPWRLWRLWRALRAFRPDLAFVLNSVSFSVTSAIIAVASRAPVIVGGDSRPFGWDLSRQLYSLEMPSEPELTCHAVAHSLHPLRAIGITTENLATVVDPAPAETAAARRLLAQYDNGQPVWVLHPGAGKRDNLWPAESFAAIASQAVAAGKRVLVLQGPADQEVCRRLQAALAAETGETSTPDVVLLPPQTVGVCAALLARADCFLCNDTGLMHVAGAVGVPSVALFGPTDPALWKPLAATVKAVRGEGDRLDTIPVELVWREMQRVSSRDTVQDRDSGSNPDWS